MSTTLRILATTAIASIALILTGCVGPNVQADGEPRVAAETWTETTTGSAPAGGTCELSSSADLVTPDADCTPGSITSAISPADPGPVCLASNADQPEPADDVADRILAAYGIDSDKADDYLLDYLVPRSLGGANDYANLWPIPVNDQANAQKDQVDRLVADAVCNERAGIQAAQFVMANDWPTALKNLNLAG